MVTYDFIPVTPGRHSLIKSRENLRGRTELGRDRGGKKKLLLGSCFLEFSS